MSFSRVSINLSASLCFKHCYVSTVFFVLSLIIVLVHALGGIRISAFLHVVEITLFLILRAWFNSQRC